MKIETIKGVPYKLPGSLTTFQKDMYVHLINWKWKYVSKDVGIYNYKGTKIEYDAILPISVHKKYPIIYPSILPDLLAHKKVYDFKLHIHFNHMASSQAANVNLFLPILLSPKANDILRFIKPDFKKLAINELYKGFRIEYWDGNSDTDKGILGDHNARSGTDSDIGIAYYNQEDELCLWLIEHKLTEQEFTECGANKSKGRDKSKHLCDKSFSDILKNKNYCYYHDVRKNNYWNITDNYQSFFVNQNLFDSCPFRGGMNQLWRNQLLGLAIENDPAQPYKHVYFSVVNHPDNPALDKSIDRYKNLIAHNPKFSTFKSRDVINAAALIKDPTIDDWIKWYMELYKL
jgi:hypothetical protein